MKIHILNCGYIRIHEDLMYGGGSIMMVNLPGHQTRRAQLFSAVMKKKEILIPTFTIIDIMDD